MSYSSLIIVFFLFNFNLYSMENTAIYNKKALFPIIDHAKNIINKKPSNIPHFIAIAGCTAVGKSYMANELADLLKERGINVVVLNCDDFLNPDHYDKDNFHPRFEHALAHSIIQKIKKGKKIIVKPAWSPEELRPPNKIQEKLVLEGVDLILFEGEFTLCEQPPYDFKKYSDFGIWVDAANEDMAEWNWLRGRIDTQNTTKEIYINNLKSYLQKYRNFTESCAKLASYLILKDSNHCYQVVHSSHWIREIYSKVIK